MNGWLIFGIVSILYLLHRVGMIPFFCPFCFIRGVVAGFLKELGRIAIRKIYEQHGEENGRLIIEQHMQELRRPSSESCDEVRA